MPFRGVLIFATGYHQSLVPQRYRDVLLFKGIRPKRSCEGNAQMGLARKAVKHLRHPQKEERWEHLLGERTETAPSQPSLEERIRRLEEQVADLQQQVRQSQ